MRGTEEINLSRNRGMDDIISAKEKQATLKQYKQRRIICFHMMTIGK